jgi:hypothetical protein
MGRDIQQESCILTQLDLWRYRQHGSLLASTIPCWAPRWSNPSAAMALQSWQARDKINHRYLITIHASAFIDPKKLANGVNILDNQTLWCPAIHSIWMIQVIWGVRLIEIWSVYSSDRSQRLQCGKKCVLDNFRWLPTEGFESAKRMVHFSVAVNIVQIGLTNDYVWMWVKWRWQEGSSLAVSLPSGANVKQGWAREGASLT